MSVDLPDCSLVLTFCMALSCLFIMMQIELWVGISSPDSAAFQTASVGILNTPCSHVIPVIAVIPVIPVVSEYLYTCSKLYTCNTFHIYIRSSVSKLAYYAKHVYM